jgi:hypothetical protein
MAARRNGPDCSNNGHRWAGFTPKHPAKASLQLWQFSTSHDLWKKRSLSLEKFIQENRNHSLTLGFETIRNWIFCSARHTSRSEDSSFTPNWRFESQFSTCSTRQASRKKDVSLNSHFSHSAKFSQCENRSQCCRDFTLTEWELCEKRPNGAKVNHSNQIGTTQLTWPSE